MYSEILYDLKTNIQCVEQMKEKGHSLIYP